MSITTGLQVPVHQLTVLRKTVRHRTIIDRKKKFFTGKRIVDIGFSILFIGIVLSWLVPLVALIIWLDSRGPIFFLQKRVGRGGRSFTCIKFRTMIVNPEADTRQATENDDRITRAGRFLRDTNIDEFPQFINVLLGDMSVVGPRPHMHADCTRFGQLIPRYKFRNLVKPGITGLAQVKGYHGHAAGYENIFRRYQWDIYYIQHVGWQMDAAILFQTAFQRFSQKNKHSG